MSDTSTEAIERARRKLILHGYSESADLLRALAAERDALRAALERLDSLSAHDAAIVAAALNAKTPPGEAPSGVTPR